MSRNLNLVTRQLTLNPFFLFFSKGKKELLQQQAFSNTTQQGQEGLKFLYLAKQYFASLHKRSVFL